jgi:hypothetical protein
MTEEYKKNQPQMQSRQAQTAIKTRLRKQVCIRAAGAATLLQPVSRKS